MAVLEICKGCVAFVFGAGGLKSPPHPRQKPSEARVGLACRRDMRSPLVQNLLRIVHTVFAKERAQRIEGSRKS